MAGDSVAESRGAKAAPVDPTRATLQPRRIFLPQPFSTHPRAAILPNFRGLNSDGYDRGRLS